MKIQNGEISLAGTLTTPKGKAAYPLIICFHGSGPLDRNENTKHQKLNTFNELAKTLAANGMACFRYDKRGIGQSTGRYISAGHHDLVSDALAVTRFFKQSDAFSQIFLLGHSEGTIIAPQLAEKCPVDGLLLLCPFTSKVEDLQEQQALVLQDHIDTAKGFEGWFGRLLYSFSGGVAKSNRKLIHRVRHSSKAVLWHNFSRVEAQWIRDFLEIDPCEIFRKIHHPTLVLSAGNDLQCPPEDGLEIAKIIGDQADYVLIPGLSHMLRMEGEITGYAGYEAQFKKPMAAEVSKEIISWLKKQTTKPENN